MVVLIVGLVLFLGVHSVRIFAEPFRQRRIADAGLGRWKGLYSLVALIGLVLIVWGYGIARQAAPILYDPPIWMRHLNMALMFFAFVALAVSQLPAGRLKARLKHPMLLAVKIWAFGHLLANGDLAALLLFGTFLAWAVADRIAAKRRGEEGPAPGPAKWDAAAVVLGAVLYVVFLFWLHEWLIGVPVLV